MFCLGELYGAFVGAHGEKLCMGHLKVAFLSVVANMSVSRSSISRARDLGSVTTMDMGNLHCNGSDGR